jgi:hypothetical protein
MSRDPKAPAQTILSDLVRPRSSVLQCGRQGDWGRCDAGRRLRRAGVAVLRPT